MRALRRADPVLAAAMRRVPPFPGFPGALARIVGSHFHALARAIIYQQLATKAAATIHNRVVALTPGPRFPRPEQILALSTETLRSAGLSRAKVAAVTDLAERVQDGRLRLASLSRLDDDRIVEELIKVRGIGEWTAQMFLIFRLGRLDVLPTGDLAVQEGMRRLDSLDQRPTPADLRRRAEPWRPLRSVASWVLWRLYDPASPAVPPKR